MIQLTQRVDNIVKHLRRGLIILGASEDSILLQAAEKAHAPILAEFVEAVEDATDCGRDKLAMRALEDLTPGGSEYVGDIPRCVEYIKQRQSSQHGRIVGLVKQLREIQGEGE